MEFSGKMKSQAFHLSLENTYFEKPHGGGGGGVQMDPRDVVGLSMSRFFVFYYFDAVIC